MRLRSTLPESLVHHSGCIKSTAGALAPDLIIADQQAVGAELKMLGRSSVHNGWSPNSVVIALLATRFLRTWRQDFLAQFNQRTNRRQSRRQMPRRATVRWVSFNPA